MGNLFKKSSNSSNKSSDSSKRSSKKSSDSSKRSSDKSSDSSKRSSNSSKRISDLSKNVSKNGFIYLKKDKKRKKNDEEDEFKKGKKPTLGENDGNDENMKNCVEENIGGENNGNDGQEQNNDEIMKNYVETKIGEIIDEYTLDNLNKLIGEVKKRNGDSLPIYINAIKEKIEEEKKENPNLEEDIKENYRMDVDDFILVLGDAKLFKNAFLVGNYRKYLILNQIAEDIESYKIIQDNNDNEKKKKMIDLLINNFNKKYDNLKKSKLQLFLSSVDNVWVSNPVSRRLLSPFFKYGVMHASLLVDQIIIEWGNGLCGGELVCPSCSSELLFSIEIEEKGILSKIKEFFVNLYNNIINFIMGRWELMDLLDDELDKIAKICVDYNIKESYNPMTNNCQKFVETILSKIGCEIKIEGEMKNVLNELKKKGEIIPFYKDKKFNTRKELDDCVKDLNFEKLCMDDQKLFFSYRNFYDLYLKNYPDDEKYQTTQESEEMWKNLTNKYNKKI